jgi:putative PIN family toxin of toxin-antitoxin system
MIRAVIDTNILIRAFIKPGGTVAPVLEHLRAGDYTLIYSESLLDELLGVLALPRIQQKYRVDNASIEALVGLIALRGDLVVPTRRVQVCRDHDDDMVIEAALAGDAQVVATGDDDLLVFHQFETIRFCTPQEFLRLIEAEVAAP